VESTPHESREGGYQYIWGGPDETADIIENVFAGRTKREVVKEVVERLDNESSLWVPSSSRRQAPPEDAADWDDLDGLELSPEELHKEMQGRIGTLEAALKHVPKPPSGMGHNRPPEPMDVEPLDQKDRAEIMVACETLKAQPPEPMNKDAATAAYMQLGAKQNKLRSWLAQQGTVFATEAVKESGKQFGKWAPAAFWLFFYGSDVPR
jgi:hypothetical protein